MDCDTFSSGTRKNDSRRLMFQTWSDSFLHCAALKKTQKSDYHLHRTESDKYKYQVYPLADQMTVKAYETPGTEMIPNVLFPYFVTMVQCWADSVASAQSICSCWSAFRRAFRKIEHIWGDKLFSKLFIYWSPGLIFFCSHWLIPSRVYKRMKHQSQCSLTVISLHFD